MFEDIHSNNAHPGKCQSMREYFKTSAFKLSLTCSLGWTWQWGFSAQILVGRILPPKCVSLSDWILVTCTIISTHGHGRKSDWICQNHNVFISDFGKRKSSMETCLQERALLTPPKQDYNENPVLIILLLCYYFYNNHHKIYVFIVLIVGWKLYEHLLNIPWFVNDFLSLYFYLL